MDPIELEFPEDVELFIVQTDLPSVVQARELEDTLRWKLANAKKGVPNVIVLPDCIESVRYIKRLPSGPEQ